MGLGNADDRYLIRLQKRSGTAWLASVCFEYPMSQDKEGLKALSGWEASSIIPAWSLTSGAEAFIQAVRVGHGSLLAQ